MLAVHLAELGECGWVLDGEFGASRWLGGMGRWGED